MVASEKLYVNFRSDGRKDGSENEKFYTGDITKKMEGDITVLSVSLHLTQLPHVYARVIDEQKGVYADISLKGEIKGVLSRRQFNPFWSAPSFERDLSKLPDNIQNMLLKMNDGYVAVLPVINDDFNVTLTCSESENTLRFCLSKCYSGAFEMQGTFAVLAAAEHPYDAVKKAYRYACDRRLIQTRLREEKALAPMYQGLGWCTWDAFYREVCEESIFQKLEEFRQKSIPVKWVVIDDGWSYVSDEEQCMLRSFREDRTKFPNGLKACVDKMKREYGVEHVGVWHALTGYWFGIEKDSEVYCEQRQNLIETNSGLYIPDGEKAYDFFCAWYEYLKAQGIDFVKIDGQGNILEYYKGQKDCVAKCRALQAAADRAVHDCFDGNVINCMAMNNINVQNRPYTALSRNSDDFLPRKPESFLSHILQNAYNAVFHSQLFYCDYDMWQSYDVTAKISSVLRAISGGPVYLSDAVNQTEDIYVKPLLDGGDKLILCDGCALPMEEHLFNDPRNGILKLINKKKNGYVVAVFNLSDREKTTTVCPEDLQCDYVAYKYFAQKFEKDLPLRLELEAFDAEIINFYPVTDGVIEVGDLTKYISAGGSDKRSVDAL